MKPPLLQIAASLPDCYQAVTLGFLHELRCEILGQQLVKLRAKLLELTQR
jgi:hypothetical protein